MRFWKKLAPFMVCATLVLASVGFSSCKAIGSLFGNGSSDDNTSQSTETSEDPEIRAVYELYVKSCAAENTEPKTYEEWLKSIQGAKGDQGDKGETGNGWLYGNGAPASTLGRNGDLYLDYSSWNVYTKDNGTWTYRGNIKGAKGDPADGGSSGDETATATMDIHFLELGNGNAGDCILIKTGNTEVLIDAGSKRGSAPTVVSTLKKYCTDGLLEYVIVTHAHEDHIASFVGETGKEGVFANFKCGTIIDYAKKKTTSQISKDYEAARDKEVSQDGAVHYTALQCVQETGGAKKEYTIAEGISFEILEQAYYSTTNSDENNYSVCTLFTQGDYHYLFTGDLEEAGEQSLVQLNPDLPHCKLFKAGHHGSKTSSNDVLLSKITPENVCVCCCAGSSEYTDNDENQFPTQAMVDRVAKYTKNIYVTTLSVDGTANKYTSMNGEITVSSNGIDFSIHGSNNDTILKETAWFQAHRTWPANGVQ